MNASSDLLSRSISPDELPNAKRSMELLSLARNGDRQALEELVTRYQERIRRIVRIQLGASLLRRHYDSMDIVQSTFNAALPKIREFQPRAAGGLLQWLALIATNQIRDLNDRHRALIRDMGRDKPFESDRAASDSGAQLMVDEPRPDERALLNEVRELLDDEVARLPEDQRRVVVLRDYCGEDWDRVAAELERESGATRQLHQRAWISLRRALGPKLAGRT